MVASDPSWPRLLVGPLADAHHDDPAVRFIVDDHLRTRSPRHPRHRPRRRPRRSRPTQCPTSALTGSQVGQQWRGRHHRDDLGLAQLVVNPLHPLWLSRPAPPGRGRFGAADQRDPQGQLFLHGHGADDRDPHVGPIGSTSTSGTPTSPSATKRVARRQRPWRSHRPMPPTTSSSRPAWRRAEGGRWSSPRCSRPEGRTAKRPPRRAETGLVTGQRRVRAEGAIEPRRRVLAKPTANPAPATPGDTLDRGDRRPTEGILNRSIVPALSDGGPPS